MSRGEYPEGLSAYGYRPGKASLVDGPTIAGVLSVPRFLEVMDTWAQFITGSLDPRKGVVQE